MVSTVFPRIRQAICAVAVAGLAAAGFAGPAAADVPPPPGNPAGPNYSVRIDQESIAYTAEQDWFNGSTDRYVMNIVTPYPGNEVRCWRFHGVNHDCWQADPSGEFHQLKIISLSTVTASGVVAGRPFRNTFFFPGTYTDVAASGEFWNAVTNRPADTFPALTRWVLDPRNVAAVNSYAPLLLPVFQGGQSSSEILTSSQSSRSIVLNASLSG